MRLQEDPFQLLTSSAILSTALMDLPRAAWMACKAERMDVGNMEIKTESLSNKGCRI